MLAEFVLIGSGYLFGSLPFTTALAKVRGLNLSQEGDLHIALWHKAGKMPAILAGAVDFLKGAIPMLIGFGFGLSDIVVAFSGVAVTAGEMWPPFPGCHGEKGNSTGVGVLMTLALLYEAYMTLLSLVSFATGAALAYHYEKHRIASPEAMNREAKLCKPIHPIVLSLPLGMILGFIVAPVASWCSKGLTKITLGFFALFIIIAVRRLTAGLKADLRKSNNTTIILINRFLFDQSLIKSGGPKEK